MICLLYTSRDRREHIQKLRDRERQRRARTAEELLKGQRDAVDQMCIRDSNNVIYMSGMKGDSFAELALQYDDGYQANILSFANNVHTPEEMCIRDRLTRTRAGALPMPRKPDFARSRISTETSSLSIPS